MINDIDKEKLTKKFGALMMRRVIAINMLKSYQKDVEEVDKEITSLIDEYTGDNDNGSAVQQKK